MVQWGLWVPGATSHGEDEDYYFLCANSDSSFLDVSGGCTNCCHFSSWTTSSTNASWRKLDTQNRWPTASNTWHDFHWLRPGCMNDLSGMRTDLTFRHTFFWIHSPSSLNVSTLCLQVVPHPIWSEFWVCSDAFRTLSIVVAAITQRLAMTRLVIECDCRKGWIPVGSVRYLGLLGAFVYPFCT